MDKKQLLEKRLATYVAMAAAVVAAGDAHGQVVYTDIDPDVSLGADETYDLDLNDDGIVDFVIGNRTASEFQKAEIYVSSAAANAIVGYTGSLGYYYPSALEAGTNIGDGGNWIVPHPYATMLIAYTTGGNFGQFNGVEDKYIGLQFAVDGNTHFGYVRLDVAVGASTVTIKDYAFNATVDADIEAGATVSEPTSLDVAQGMFTPYVYAHEKRIRVQLPDNYSNADVSIMNITGKVIHREVVGERTELDMHHLPSGVYFVRVQAGAVRYTTKISL